MKNAKLKYMNPCRNESPTHPLSSSSTTTQLTSVYEDKQAQAFDRSLWGTPASVFHCPALPSVLPVGHHSIHLTLLLFPKTETT